MPDEDENFCGSLVWEIGIWWHHLKIICIRTSALAAELQAGGMELFYQTNDEQYYCYHYLQAGSKYSCTTDEDEETTTERANKCGVWFLNLTLDHNLAVFE